MTWFMHCTNGRKYRIMRFAGAENSFLFHGHCVPSSVGMAFCVTLYHAVGCNRLLLHDTKSQNNMFEVAADHHLSRHHRARTTYAFRQTQPKLPNAAALPKEAGTALHTCCSRALLANNWQELRP